MLTKLPLVALLFCLFSSHHLLAQISVYAPDETDQSKIELKNLLEQNFENVFFANSLPEALQTKPEILILYASKRNTFEKPTPEAKEQLADTKMIGIGYSSAQLFEELDLEINADACAHNSRAQSPKIRLPRCDFLPHNEGEKLTSHHLKNTQNKRDHNFAMYLPPKDPRNQFVEVIARWEGSKNHAPIVKQGNHIMIGLAAPCDDWTSEYRLLFQDILEALSESPYISFSKAYWDITPPGTHPLLLGNSGTTDMLSSRTMYFQFEKPTTFQVKVEHAGSKNMMALFIGKNRRHWIREDSKNGDPLQIKISITAEDIAIAEDSYWKLKITNFDSSSTPIGQVIIDY